MHCGRATWISVRVCQILTHRRRQSQCREGGCLSMTGCRQQAWVWRAFMAGVVVEWVGFESKRCLCCATVCQGSLIFCDIFFYTKNIPGFTAYYFEPQIENLMTVMSLCGERLMGWRTWWFWLKLFWDHVEGFCCVARSLGPCKIVAIMCQKGGNFSDIFRTDNSFILAHVKVHKYHVYLGNGPRKVCIFLTSNKDFYSCHCSNSQFEPALYIC